MKIYKIEYTRDRNPASHVKYREIADTILIGWYAGFNACRIRNCHIISFFSTTDYDIVFYGCYVAGSSVRFVEKQTVYHSMDVYNPS